MTDLFTAISNFGFPIAITAYLLVRFEKKLESLTKVIEKNNYITDALVKAIEKNSKGIKVSNIEAKRRNDATE